MTRKIFILVVVLVGLLACQPAVSPAGGIETEPAAGSAIQDEPVADTGTDDKTDAKELTPVTLSVGFVPNVQFAPFYVAIEKGYYAEQGLALDLEYGFEHDFIQLLASGEREFVVASGDQVILARDRGLPVRYVMNWHRRYPIAIFALDDLSTPADLVGKTVGIPGLFGASYIGWLALLNAAGVDDRDITLEAIGFTQAEAVANGQVDAAVGYAVNEPLQLGIQGYDPDVIVVADYVDLVANGIVTNEDLLEGDAELVQRVVTGSLMGIRETLADPEGAFEIVLKFVPEAGDQRETQMAVLQASLDFWASDRLGYNDPEAWEVSQAFLNEAGMLQELRDIDTYFTNAFVAEE